MGFSDVYFDMDILFKGTLIDGRRTWADPCWVPAKWLIRMLQRLTKFTYALD